MSIKHRSKQLSKASDYIYQKYKSNNNQWIGLAIVSALVLLNVLPLVVVFAASFLASGPSIISGFSLNSWEIFLREGGPVILNSFIFAGGAALVTTILSGGIAWVLARTNAPFRRVYYFAIFLLFFYPPVVIETVWIRLLGDGGLYPHLLGLDSLNVYSMGGMIAVQAIRLLPIGMILLIPLFGSMDKTLEDAGRISGAGILNNLRHITGPLLLPGLLVVFVFTFLINLESFRVPLVIGLPADIPVLSIVVWEATSQPPIQYGVAMAQAVFLVAIALPMLYVYKRMLGKTNQYVTVSGEGFVSESVDVGRWRYLYSFLVGAFIFLTIVVPGIFMVYNSLLPYYMPPHITPFETIASSITLEGYTGILDQNELVSATMNSFTIAFISAFLLTGTGIGLAWVINKTKIEYRNVIDYLAFIPIGIPAVSLALGLMVIHLRLVPFFAIYGTLMIFLVAFYIKMMPSNLRVMETGVLQVDKSLIEAGRISGASIWRSLYSILVPVIYKLTRISWILSFAFIATEMPMVMMLRSPDTEMISSILYRISNQGHMHSETYALGTLIVIVLLGVVLLLHVSKYKRIGLLRW